MTDTPDNPSADSAAPADSGRAASATDSADSAAQWQRRALWLLAILAVARVLYLAVLPLDLSTDEAYYWDWSRRLDWCYYSKPPMIAWINYVSSALLGASTFSVRLPAALLSGVGALGLYALAARMYGARTGFWAMLLGQATAASWALGFLMTIDAPLSFCWTWSLYFTWRALERERGGLGWWLAAGIVGCLGLLSKQMMLLYPGLVIVFLLLTPTHRRRLLSPGPWLMLGVTLIAAVIVTVWNAHHGWVMFNHTAHHVERSPEAFSLLKVADHVGVYQLTQLGLATPVTYVVLVLVLIGTVLGWRGLDARARFLAVFCAPPLAGFVLFSFTQSINPNWPLVFYISAIPLLAAWFTGALELPMPAAVRRRREPLRRLAAGVGIAITLGGAAYGLLVLPLGIAGSKADFGSRARGWQALGTKVGEAYQQVPNPERTIVVAGKRKTLAALAFYMPQQPHVYRFNTAPGSVESQYDVWPDPITEGHLGSDALLVFELNANDPDATLPAGLAECFESVTVLADVIAPMAPLPKGLDPAAEAAAAQAALQAKPRRARAYRIWHAQGLRSWSGVPASDAPPAP